MQEYEELFGVSTSSKTKNRTSPAEEESSASSGLAIDIRTVLQIRIQVNPDPAKISIRIQKILNLDPSYFFTLSEKEKKIYSQQLDFLIKRSQLKDRML